jgi:hypothetical protein
MLTLNIDLEGRLALLPVHSNAVTEQSRGISESGHLHAPSGPMALVPRELPWQIIRGAVQVIRRDANSNRTGIDVDTT